MGRGGGRREGGEGLASYCYDFPVNFNLDFVYTLLCIFVVKCRIQNDCYDFMEIQ